MNYKVYRASDHLLFEVVGDFYRLKGDVFERTMMIEQGMGTPIASGVLSARSNAMHQMSFTHPRGSFHINIDDGVAYATAGHENGSPKCSGQLQGQTGETAEQRLREFLFHDR